MLGSTAEETQKLSGRRNSGGKCQAFPSAPSTCKPILLCFPHAQVLSPLTFFLPNSARLDKQLTSGFGDQCYKLP